MSNLADHYKCQKCGKQVPAGMLCSNCLYNAGVNKNEQKEEEGMKPKTEPNDMAFPIKFNAIRVGTEVIQGMTKREYFSIMALQGMLANSDFSMSVSMVADLLNYSVIIADKLIKELNK